MFLDLYKDRSTERRTRVGEQDFVVNCAAARANGPHRFDGSFDFGVSGRGFPHSTPRAISGATFLGAGLLLGARPWRALHRARGCPSTFVAWTTNWRPLYLLRRNEAGTAG